MVEGIDEESSLSLSVSGTNSSVDGSGTDGVSGVDANSMYF